MKLIALNNLEVYKNGTISRNALRGEIIGELKSNNNDGTYLLKSGEIVDEKDVAVYLDDAPVAINYPSAEIQKVNDEYAKRTKYGNIIAMAIIAGGAYAIFKGKKGLGIGLIVTGLIIYKRNYNNLKYVL